MRPNGFAIAYNNLGATLKDLGRLAEARQAVEIEKVALPPFGQERCKIGILRREVDDGRAEHGAAGGG